MRILLAPDKFKGTLTAAQVAAAIAKPLADAGHTIETVPIADGGDGTVAAAVAHGFTEHTTIVTGPLGTPTTARWATAPVSDTASGHHGPGPATPGKDAATRRCAGNGSGTAIIELAEASGLALLPQAPDADTTLRATTYGTGELILAALDAGAHTIVIGVGGSATTDGGRGMLEALGWPDHLDPRLDDAHIVLASDVTNPLLGPSGAAAVFGPQKGAGPTEVTTLEGRLAEFAVRLDPDRRWTNAPGAGAAGGTGFAALAALGAESRPGADYVMELVGFAAALKRADLVITGEGSFDTQSLDGKGPGAVLDAAQTAGVPAIVVAGTSELDATAHPALRAVYRLTDFADVETCLAKPAQVLEQAAAESVRSLE